MVQIFGCNPPPPPQRGGPVTTLGGRLQGRGKVHEVVLECQVNTIVDLWPRGGPRDASEGMRPERRPQKRLGRRLEEVAKAVGGGYCRLQMPLKLALGVRGTVAGHRLGALEPPPPPGRRAHTPLIPHRCWSIGIRHRPRPLCASATASSWRRRCGARPGPPSPVHSKSSGAPGTPPASPWAPARRATDAGGGGGGRYCGACLMPVPNCSLLVFEVRMFCRFHGLPPPSGGVAEHRTHILRGIPRRTRRTPRLCQEPALLGPHDTMLPPAPARVARTAPRLSLSPPASPVHWKGTKVRFVCCGAT